MSRFLIYDDQIINILLKEEKPSGGAAVQTYSWIRGLMEADQEVFIMTKTSPHDELKDDCKNLKLISFYNSDKGIRWLRWIYYRIPFIFWRIKELKPDYLYQSVPGWTSFILGIICNILHVKFIVRISNDYLVDERIFQKHSKAYWLLQQQGLRMAQYVLCQNDYQYKKVKNYFPAKHVFKISNPVYQKYTGALQNTESRSYIAWVGIFQYQKNLKLLFEIATCLTKLEFRVAGKALPKCDDETHLYLSKLSKLPNVRFVGYLERSEVLHFISRARYLLNTSHYEGFSNTFLEAMSAGTPIISGEKVNPDSIVTNYSLGLIYKDVNDLERKLREVSAKQYDQMIINTTEFVLHNHDCNVLALKLISLLKGKNTPLIQYSPNLIGVGASVSKHVE